jgi:hypothetical protein
MDVSASDLSGSDAAIDRDHVARDGGGRLGWCVEEELTEHLTPRVDDDMAIVLGLEVEV